MPGDGKKIAVIGGSSALAQYLVPALGRGNTVVTLGRRDCDLNLDVRGDLENFALPKDTDTVLYLAAAFGGELDQDILETVETNALGTLKACMAAARAGVRHFVFVSSIYAALPDSHPYASFYSLSKRHAEELAAAYCRRTSMKLAVLRPSQIYDARGAFRESQGLPYWMADQAQADRPIAIHGAHDAARNYLHAEDLAEIILRVALREIEGVYPCLYPENIRLSEIAQCAQAAFSSSAAISFLSSKGDIPDTVFSYDSGLYDAIGYVPKIGMAEGMRKIAEARKGGAA
jgi:UDP-glucose 4-epimerase